MDLATSVSKIAAVAGFHQLQQEFILLLVGITKDRPLVCEGV